MPAVELIEEELRDFPHSRSMNAIKSMDVVRGASVGLPLAESFMAERVILNDEIQFYIN